MAYYRKKEFKKREWGINRECVCPDPILLEVVCEENDSIERLIKRFLKKFKKSKLMEEIKEHEHYDKPSTKRREKKKRAKAKIRKAQEERDRKDNS